MYWGATILKWTEFVFEELRISDMVSITTVIQMLLEDHVRHSNHFTFWNCCNKCTRQGEANQIIYFAGSGRQARYVLLVGIVLPGHSTCSLASQWLAASSCSLEPLENETSLPELASTIPNITKSLVAEPLQLADEDENATSHSLHHLATKRLCSSTTFKIYQFLRFFSDALGPKSSQASSIPLIPIKVTLYQWS
jgi:hypothetical protein